MRYDKIFNSKIMTAKQSLGRMLLYGIIAGLTPIASNWSAMEHATAFQWGGMILQGLLTAFIAIRAYIDTSVSKIES